MSLQKGWQDSAKLQIAGVCGATVIFIMFISLESEAIKLAIIKLCEDLLMAVIIGRASISGLDRLPSVITAFKPKKDFVPSNKTQEETN